MLVSLCGTQYVSFRFHIFLTRWSVPFFPVNFDAVRQGLTCVYMCYVEKSGNLTDVAMESKLSIHRARCNPNNSPRCSELPDMPLFRKL